jgi:hypothetical protein
MYTECHVRNDSDAAATYLGQLLTISQSYEIQLHERIDWASDSAVLADINAGDLIVNDGTDDLSASDGIELLQNMSMGRRLTIAFGDVDSAVSTHDGLAWKVMRRFTYRGSSREGTPKRFLASVRGVGTTGKIRLYDKTNTNIIAQKTIADGPFAFVSDTTLINIPVGRSLFEIQLQSDTNGSDVMVTAADLIW